MLWRLIRGSWFHVWSSFRERFCWYGFRTELTQDAKAILGNAIKTLKKPQNTYCESVCFSTRYAASPSDSGGTGVFQAALRSQPQNAKHVAFEDLEVGFKIPLEESVSRSGLGIFRFVSVDGNAEFCSRTIFVDLSCSHGERNVRLFQTNKQTNKQEFSCQSLIYFTTIFP